MTTTPGESSPHERKDSAPGGADPVEGAGAEIGMTDGEGSTFEPEEDPPED